VYYLTRHHELYAIERRTGATVWRQSLRLAASRSRTSGTTVIVERGTVVVGDDDLFAFDVQTGAPRWHFVPAGGDRPGPYLGASASGVVYAGSTTGRIYALDVATGHPAWVSGPIGARAVVFGPVVEGGLVVAAYTDFTSVRHGGVLALDASTGDLRWHAKFPSSAPGFASGAAGGPVIAADTIIATSSDGRIYGFDRTTGQVTWTLPPVAGMGEDFRPLLLCQRTLLVGSLTGVLIAVNTRTWQESWRYTSPEDGSIAFDIAADAETVYVPFASGHLTAVDLNTGVERWRVGTNDRRFEHLPAVADERLYVTSEDGLYVVAKRQ
jgi:outer membrane protein assembly factor BamB